MTSKATTQSRSTTTSTAAPVSSSKPPCTIHSSAVISEKAILTGTHAIEIGEHTVIHPYAKIRAEGGTVRIGAYCTIAEAAIVGSQTDTPGNVVIGSHVVIDGGAEVVAAIVDDYTEIGVQAIVGAGATLGKYCKIAPKLIVKHGEQLEDFTVVYGDNRRRRDTTSISQENYRDARRKGQEKQIEALKKVIPNAAAKFAAPI